jgi:hypothetical protein
MGRAAPLGFTASGGVGSTSARRGAGSGGDPGDSEPSGGLSLHRLDRAARPARE